jgi:hypothetical protein
MYVVLQVAVLTLLTSHDVTVTPLSFATAPTGLFNKTDDSV